MTNQARERLIVIGNGMAGCRAVEEVLKRDPAWAGDPAGEGA